MDALQEKESPLSIEDALSEIRKQKEEGAHFSCMSGFSAGAGNLGIAYHFIKDKKPIDIKVVFPEKTVVPSIRDIFPSASYYEVEAHEMFGINFDKPDSGHMFLPDDWPEGKYPLRKQ